MPPVRQTPTRLRSRRRAASLEASGLGCFRAELVADMSRVDRPGCSVVVAMAPWTEPGSRFTRDFERECAWLMTVANQKTVSGFPHVAWRTAGDIAHRVAERLKAAIPSPFDHLTLIGVDETSYRKGHTYITVVVDHERHRAIWEYDGYGRDVFGLFFKALKPEQRSSIRVATGTGRAGSTHASPSTARTRNACSTASTSSPG